ncbi:hypothetical protein DEU56DRAFT_912410 [Suillus clintonianus]|uniref:uncharacterized protein n=1 Tax=Suillus clintonianus TaxID=1904413 RepID=UPI001B883127|nr:uncharacterized protein DEU56DRAFT_912410 [Suillus clintonianus]KAG2138547.1 hypothetical protein DEU56DRAFT_912410 [Suillus clintonianus]
MDIQRMDDWQSSQDDAEDSALLGVILSSDKTNITNMTGGHAAHPLLISLANIKMAVRNKASSHTFLLTALLPIAEFLHPVKHMQGVLEARLIHQCLDIILEPFKQAARIGSKTTLTQLKNIKSICDPLNVEAFFAACEPNCLSGVVDLFWCDWPFVDPNLFLTPEALHHWHHESYDHNVQWCIKIVGVKELNFCFSVLQLLMTFRHFKQGISTLKQVTGRAQRDIQCYLVAIIANAAPPGVVIAVRALMDFCYLSQAVTINKKQCQKILDALKMFHNHKHEVIAHGGHRGAKSKNILDNWYISKARNDAKCCAEYLSNMLMSIAQQPQSQTHTTTAGYRDDPDDGIDDDENTDEAGDIQAAISDLWGTGHVVLNFFKKAQLVSLSTTAPRPLRMFVVGSTAIRLNFDPSLQHQAIDNVAGKFCLPDL